MSAAPSFSWPLAVSPFTLADRLAVSWWMLKQDRYTMGAKVAELERWFSDYSGMHALMVANGSLANTLVFELWKLKHPGRRALVMVPAVTWISSITPALMAGLDIEFCDVNLDDFAFDYARLDAQVAAARARGVEDIIIWPTALIGFAPDMERLRGIAQRHRADLFLDSCENTFSRVTTYRQVETHPATEQEPARGIQALVRGSILASADITTTSCYLSHQICSVEGGFVFFRNEADYNMARMFRNHGMARSLAADHPLRLQIEAANPEVDPQFLFALPGTNLRPSDMHAAFGLRDCRRAEQAKAHRLDIYRQFRDSLDENLYYLPPHADSHVGFCLPIFTKGDNLREVKALLRGMGVESRPIIGSNLLYQPPFQQYGKPEDYPNAMWIHKRGTYVGLHHKVTPAMVARLTDSLNNI